MITDYGKKMKKLANQEEIKLMKYENNNK